MWIIQAILVHIALLGSIFVIYFRSPVISGLSPQKDIPNAPANRLVLIVTDGLRAESFFKDQCADIPNIRRLIRSQGLVGISQTRVPTESRPGHIALIAGLYEDPSAVLRGWKTNPIDFDNVFNRSAHTYAWGAMDVLHIFSKITAEETLMIDAYDEYDFTGKNKSSATVDQWVFERVKLFLERKIDALQKEKKVVFFLHLLGLDIAGHVHKPGSELFLETLHSTDKGIYETYELFESKFPDHKTAYILTSDHGMTNHGSHGAGDQFETETPFLVWGAGVNNWEKPLDSEKTITIGDVVIPLITIEQGQVAPLMSSLIGLPPPMNSFGKLPKDIMNVSSEYMATASYINALQLIAQFNSLLTTFNRGAFSAILPSFKGLKDESVVEFKKNAEKLFDSKNFERVVEESYAMMQKALDGIDYYHTYYQNLLLFCTSLSLLIWMFCLVTFFVHSRPLKSWRSFVKPVIVGLLLLAFIFLQKITMEVGFYIILPVLMWSLAIQSSQGKLRWLKSLLTKRNLITLLTIILAAVLMVSSFFRRQFITIVFLLFALVKFKSVAEEGVKFYIWLVLSCIVSTFPLLSDVMGQKNDTLLLFGALLVLARRLILKSSLPRWMYIVAIIGFLNTAFCVFKHNNLESVPLACRTLSWIFLVLSLSAPFYVTSNSLKVQVEIVFFSLSLGYVLVSTSFEVIFVGLLGSQLMLSFSSSKKVHLGLDSSREYDTHNMAESFEYALAILLYTLFTFFGTGNTASVSSFDPNVMRCFITTFSPFIIMGLVIVKLFLPLLLSVAIIYGTIGPNLNERNVFIAMLFICDVMGLQFLYLVRNKGSWLEIGSSISHFVIMEVTTLVLVATTYLVKLYLKMPLTTKKPTVMEKIK